MRKISSFAILYFIPLFLFSQQQNEKYRYPVKRGSAAWDSLKTYAEKRASSQIPPDVLRRLSTAALLESVLDYPLIGDVFVFNSLQDGVDKLKVNFSAFEELLERKDVGLVTLSRYYRFKVDSVKTLPTPFAKGEYSVKMSFLEVLLAQPEITGQLNTAEKRGLLRHLVSNFDRKGAQREDYGGLSLGTSAWTVYHLNRQLAGDKKTTASDSMLVKGVLLDAAPWQAVIKEARKNLK